jgi:hypothetical protein
MNCRFASATGDEFVICFAPLKGLPSGSPAAEPWQSLHRKFGGANSQSTSLPSFASIATVRPRFVVPKHVMSCAIHLNARR